MMVVTSTFVPVGTDALIQMVGKVSRSSSSVVSPRLIRVRRVLTLVVVR